MLNRLTRCMLASSEIQVSEVETLTELETSELPTTTSSSSSSDTSVDWSYWLSPVQQPASDTTSKLQLIRWHKQYSTSDCLVFYQQSNNNKLHKTTQLSCAGTSYGPVSVYLHLSQVSVLSNGVGALIWFLAWQLFSTSPTLCYKKIQVYTKE